MAKTFNLAEIAHDMCQFFGGKVVLDEKQIVEARREGIEHPFPIGERNKIVDIVVVAGGIIKKGEGVALENEVVVSDKVDGEFRVDVPGQFVVGHARIDADDGSVLKRRDLYFSVFGTHGAKIGIL